jgi:hypothetical protein
VESTETGCTATLSVETTRAHAQKRKARLERR